MGFGADHGETARSRTTDAGYITPYDVFFWLCTAFLLATCISAVAAGQAAWAVVFGVFSSAGVFVCASWYLMENDDER